MNMTEQEVAAIASQVAEYDEANDALWQHMVTCGFIWREVAEANPQMTAEEIASAAACGFEVAP